MGIEREAFKAWFKKEYPGIDNLANQGDEGAITRRDYAYVGWQAAKAKAVPEIQQSKQAEIDDLKAQLKAAHESRIEFVEYCRKIESNDFVLVPKEPTEKMLDAARRRQWDDLSSPLEDMDVLKYKAMIAAAQEPK